MRLHQFNVSRPSMAKKLRHGARAAGKPISDGADWSEAAGGDEQGGGRSWSLKDGKTDVGAEAWSDGCQDLLGGSGQSIAIDHRQNRHVGPPSMAVLDLA